MRRNTSFDTHAKQPKPTPNRSLTRNTVGRFALTRPQGYYTNQTHQGVGGQGEGEGYATMAGYYGSETQSSYGGVGGHVLGGGQGNTKSAGLQNRTERLQAQFQNDVQVFKEKQALKEAKKREEFLKKTAKYAGNVLGVAEASNSNNHNASGLHLRTLRLQENYQRDVVNFQKNEEKKKALEKEKMMKKYENLNKNTEKCAGNILGRGEISNNNNDNTSILQLRNLSLQENYQKDVENFQERKENEKFLKETMLKKNENLNEDHLNQVGTTSTETDHEKALRLRTERLQAQYNRDVNAFKIKQEMGKTKK